MLMENRDFYEGVLPLISGPDPGCRSRLVVVVLLLLVEVLVALSPPPLP